MLKYVHEYLETIKDGEETHICLYFDKRVKHSMSDVGSSAEGP